MINGIRVKVCGITSRGDAEMAAKGGADCIGFILHPQSPRYVSLEAFQAMRADLPPVKTVGVVVEPSHDELVRIRDAGFDFIQLHFCNSTPFPDAIAWLDVVNPEKLWLAPRIPAGKSLDLVFIALADTMLIDSYHPDRFGGSGETGDWKTFARLQSRHKEVSWVLAGGLTPANIAEAVRVAKARFVDVNSGVEASPGVKDPVKLQAFFDALHAMQPAAARPVFART